LTPLEVMTQNMNFWFRQADILARQMERLVVTNDPASQREAALLRRDFLDAKANAERCAVDLAPYTSPRISNVDYNPPPQPLDAASAIPPGCSPIEAAEVYRKLVRGIR
jgi:hypothetical protein